MKSILILFFLGVSLSLFSQSDFDKRLLVKFSEEQIVELQQKNPAIVGYMEYYLNNGYSLIPKSQLNGKTTSGKLNKLKANKINPFDLDVPLPLNEDVYYSIEGKDEVLVLFGRKKMMAEYQHDLKNQELNK